MKDLDKRNELIVAQDITISNIFDKSLQGLLKGYCSRDAQKNLSEDIHNVLRGQGVGVFEAGTGTGKIKLLNFHNQQGRGGGNSTLTSYRSNFNTILLGKVR